MEDPLSIALDWWRATRDPDLAHLIEAFRPSASPQRGRDKDHGAWLNRAAAATDADVAPLLDSLDQTRNGEQALVRLERIVERGPDPRLVSAVVRWIVRPRYRSTPAFWELVFHTLGQDAPADLDCEALAAALLRHDQTRFAITTASRLRRLKIASPAPRALSPEQRVAVDEWLAAFARRPPPPTGPAPSATVEELLALVAADPDADDAREVLADYWLERGEPRGRFLRLQLDRARREAGDPNLGREPRTEERALLGAHESEWFGPWLAAIRYHGDGAEHLGHCARGFPHAVHLFERLKHLGNLQGDPCLASVRSLQLPTARRAPALVPFLADPVMRHVRQLWNVGAELAAPVLEACPQAELVVFSLPTRIDDIAAIASCFPNRRYVAYVFELHAVPALRVRELALVAGSGVPAEVLVGILDPVASEVQRLTLQLNNRGVALERTGRGWRIRAVPLVGTQPNRLVHTSVGLIRRLLDRGDVELPSADPAPPGVVYAVNDANDLTLCAELPAAPLVVEHWFPGAALPADREVWGPPKVLWHDAPQVARIGDAYHNDGTLVRLVRREDGRADARVTGTDLHRIDPLSDQIARVIGWGPEVEAWCARRGLPLEAP